MWTQARFKAPRSLAARLATILRRPVNLMAFAALLFEAVPASATVSVLAYDAEAEALGATVVSCLDAANPEFRLKEVVRLDAKSGGVVAQSYFFEEGRDTVLGALRAGSTAEQALLTVTSEEFDPTVNGQGYAFRQYGVVDIEQGHAAFTGSEAQPVALAHQATHEKLTYVIAGNLLTDDQVVENLENGFTAPGTHLADRFVHALEKMLDGGGGDQRCAPRSSNTGYAMVMLRDGSSWEREVSSRAVEPAALLIDALNEQDLLRPQQEEEPTTNHEATKPGGCQQGHSAPRLPERLGWLLAFGLSLGLVTRRRRPSRLAPPSV